MNEIEVFDNNQQETYSSIRNSVIAAQGNVYAAVNSAMVNAYWRSGNRSIRLAVRMTEPSMAKIYCNTYQIGLLLNSEKAIR